MVRVSAHMTVVHSGQTLLEACEALVAQDVPLALRMVDNGSTDGGPAQAQARYPQMVLLRNARNLGPTAALNQGVAYALAHWDAERWQESALLFVGTDVVLEEGALVPLLHVLDTYRDVGAVAAKVRKTFDEHVLDEALRERVASDHLASLGWDVSVAGRLELRGAHQVDQGQYDEAREVFGAPGWCILVRASALASIQVGGQTFLPSQTIDGAFEDLAWRLQGAGWQVRIEPTSVAYRYSGVYTQRPERSPEEREEQADHVVALLRSAPAGVLMRAVPQLVWWVVSACARGVVSGTERKHLRTFVRIALRALRLRGQVRQGQRAALEARARA